MSRILVTGGAGFIGSHLADRLVEQGDEVIIVDDLSSGNQEYLPDQAKFHQLDIQAPQTADLILDQKPEKIYHLAAQKNLRFSLENPAADASINILGSLNILEAARQAGTKSIIFASTGGAIYDQHADRPTNEQALTRPLSPYGVGKLSTEHYLYMYEQVYQLPYIALRLSNVYGPRQDPKGEAGVVAIFLDAITKNNTPKINGDGQQTRDYVFVDDVVSAFVNAGKYDKSGIFNIGTGKETSVLGLWQSIVQTTGTKIVPEHGPAIAGELLASSLSSKQARSDLNWSAQIDLSQGIKKTVDWFNK
ncbi:MAG: NAD-dependent epimerase/dehydratase family protein [bacterium]